MSVGTLGWEHGLRLNSKEARHTDLTGLDSTDQERLQVQYPCPAEKMNKKCVDLINLNK